MLGKGSFHCDFVVRYFLFQFFSLADLCLPSLCYRWYVVLYSLRSWFLINLFSVYRPDSIYQQSFLFCSSSKTLFLPFSFSIALVVTKSFRVNGWRWQVTYNLVCKFPVLRLLCFLGMLVRSLTDYHLKWTHGLTTLDSTNFIEYRLKNIWRGIVKSNRNNNFQSNISRYFDFCQNMFYWVWPCLPTDGNRLE